MSETHDTRAAGTPGRARATLKALRLMWGQLDETDPARVVRVGMYGKREIWTRVGPGLFELEGEH